MITILEKYNCCGCGACVQVCPKQCISMFADNEGFLYPQVDKAICIDCGLCEKVCPVISQNELRSPLAVYAAKNTNEDIRLKSSSGGIFTLLAEQVISEGGVVFGARFNESWEVVHDYTETVEGLEPFRGSKYVQSVIGDNFIKAKKFLTEGRKVLFSGTPCQISGLKKFLRKEFENLLTVEVVCHGVPSPMVWRDYLEYRRTKYASGVRELPKITDILFRDKSDGWKNYGLRICYSEEKLNNNLVCQSERKSNCEITPANEDIFMNGFLRNLYLRPSCFHCPVKGGKSGADMSLADYWGIESYHPTFYDQRGVGLLLIYTEKGIVYNDLISDGLNAQSTEYSFAIHGNPCIVDSVQEIKRNRTEFWNLYQTYKVKAIVKICNKLRPSKIRRCIGVIKRNVRRIILNK